MKQETIRIELKYKGEVKVIWVSLGSKKDFDAYKFGIDKIFDEVEDSYNKNKK